MFKLDLEKAEEPKTKLPSPVGSQKKQESSRKTSASLTILKLLIVWITVKGFGILNKAGIDVFLELSCFFRDPTDVGSLISGSSAFSKSSLNIWKFLVHLQLKPSLKDSEHYFASNECNCLVI